MVVFGILVGFLAAVVRKWSSLGNVNSVDDYVAKSKWSSTRQESSLSVLVDRVDCRGGRGEVWVDTQTTIKVAGCNRGAFQIPYPN